MKKDKAMSYLDYVIMFGNKSGLVICDEMLFEDKSNFHFKFAVWLSNQIQKHVGSNYKINFYFKDIQMEMPDLLNCINPVAVLEKWTKKSDIFYLEEENNILFSSCVGLVDYLERIKKGLKK